MGGQSDRINLTQLTPGCCFGGSRIKPNEMSEPTVFYNTIGLSGEELQKAISKATIQDDRIFMIMQIKARPMSASVIWGVYQAWFNNCPITSIRRSLSNLKQYGSIRWTGEYKKGIYGKPERLWEVVK